MRAARSFNAGVLVVAGLAAVLTGVGCDRAEVHSYRVPKPAGTTAPTGAAQVPSTAAADGTRPAAGAETPPAERSGKVRWTVPEGWTSVTSTQSTRVATFDADGAEVSVTAFPGSAGGLLPNINRWRGQIGLAPIGESDVPGLVRHVRVNGADVSHLSMTGADGQILLAAILEPGDGQTWFVKSTTSAAKAEQLRPVIERFAESFRVEGALAAGPASAPPTGQPSGPSSGQPFNPHAQPAGRIEDRLSRWTPPAHWKMDDQTGDFVAVAFDATNPDGGARTTATSLLNDGGGPLANINRWRGQLALPALTEFSQQPVTDVGPGTTLVDLTNPAGTDRMIAVIVPADGATWFFKLRGPPKGVEAERDAFERFVKSVGLGVTP